MPKPVLLFTGLACTLLVGGCRDADRGDADVRTTGEPVEEARPATEAPPDVRIEVSLAARELHVYRGGALVETHAVAVGSDEWPTPAGEWTIDQVVWNPRWVPPDQEWAEDAETKEPGAPDNPLGRAQLVYDRPNSIHGTDEPASIGQAVSHGSIRVTNDVAVHLARLVMEAGGASRHDGWYSDAQADQDREIEVRIPNPVPIRVIAADGEAG